MNLNDNGIIILSLLKEILHHYNFTAGMLDNIHSDHTATQDMFGSNDLVLYGFDREGLLPFEDEDYQVSVSAVTVTLSDLQLNSLNVNALHFTKTIWWNFSIHRMFTYATIILTKYQLNTFVEII